MTFAPILAHGGAILPLMGIACCAFGCLAGGFALAATSKKTSRWILGASLSLCGAVIVILSLVFFDKLVRLFA